MSAYNLVETFIHLGRGATAEPEPAPSANEEDPTGMDWYADYAVRRKNDGAEGRLVSQHTFTEGWATGEMHPNGAEVVICTHGEMVLTQEFTDGRRETITLGAGDYAINPPGVWHIADIAARATTIFITAGEGTEIRPR